jgi:multiple sugar transport system substrate-binding protein
MPYRFKRTASLMVLLGMLSALFVACGGGSGNNSSASGNCSSVQLSYWNPFTGPDGPYMGRLVASFNNAHPNIQVQMTTQSDYNTKLDTAAASDTLPDVAIINEDQIATQAFRHIIRPIDDIMPQLGYSSNDFPALAWNISQVSGHRYAIPLSIVPMTMYYNADLFKKAGLSGPPTNATDFTHDAQVLTSGGNHGFQITSGFPVQQIFQQLLHQFGGSEFSSDNTKATWNSPAGVQALQWMKNTQSMYSAPKLPVDADLNSFKQGTVGMIWNGIWQATNVTGDAVDFNGQAAATPQIGPQAATWAGMASLALPFHKKGIDKCKESASTTFIKYLEDNAVQWSKAGNIPAYNKARNSSDLQSLPLQSALAKAVENPVFPPPVPGVSDAFAPLGDAVGAVMAGTATNIQKALNDAATHADQILAQNRQKYGSTPPTS